MRHFFGTDGVRGVANQEPMTSEMALKLGRAIAKVLHESDPTESSGRKLPPSFARKNGEDGKHRYKILIGKDTRLSGYMLETALASGIVSMGADVLLVGPHADARGRVLNPEHARGRGRGDLSVAQSLSGQRHQIFLLGRF